MYRSPRVSSPARGRVEIADLLYEIEVVTARKISMVIFWLVASCELVGGYQLRLEI
jgi:hypothetical protein